MTAAVDSLELGSADPGTRFFTQTRQVNSPSGKALVVTDVAEYLSTGAKKSAVVVSAVLADGGSSGQTLTVQTHLEDQHTRFDAGIIVFDEHHDAIREALVEAITRVDPQAEHVARPTQPETSGELASPEEAREAAASAQGYAHSNPKERARFATTLDELDEGLDVRSWAGMGLLGVGVVVLLVAVASGSWPFIFFALALTGALGWAGSRIGGG